MSPAYLAFVLATTALVYVLALAVMPTVIRWANRVLPGGPRTLLVMLCVACAASMSYAAYQAWRYFT